MEAPLTIGCLPEVLKLTESLADRVLFDHLFGRKTHPDHIRLLAAVGLILHEHEIAFPPLLDRALKIAIAGGDTLVDPVTQTIDYVVSPAFQIYNAELSSRDYIEMLYKDYLGRTADTAGLEYWSLQIDTGAMDRAAVAAQIINSTEFRSRFKD